MDSMALGGIIGIIAMVGVFILALAAVIMPLVVLLINSKLNKIIKLLQALNDKQK